MKKDGGDAANEARAERLAAALRDNLKRRKAQARGRAADVPEPAAPPATTPADQAGAAAEPPAKSPAGRPDRT